MTVCPVLAAEALAKRASETYLSEGCLTGEAGLAYGFSPKLDTISMYLDYRFKASNLIGSRFFSSPRLG